MSTLLRDIYIEDNFDLEGLLDIGFIQTTDPDRFNYVEDLEDYDRIEQRILTFFDLDHIFQYDDIGRDQPKGNPILSAGEWLEGEGRKRVEPN